MTTGVSTASLFLREMNEDALTVFKELGVKCTEIFLTTFSEYTEEYARLLKERAEGIFVNSVHVLNTQFEPQLFGAHPRARKDAYEILDGVMRSARIFGAKAYTFHGITRLKKSFKGLDYPQSAADLNEISATCEKYGVALCLENVHWATYAEPGVFRKLKAYAPSLQGVFDIKQARLSGYPYAMYIKDMAGSISHVHLSDVDGNGKMCLPGKGRTDFFEVFSRLKDAGFDGAAIVEAYTGDYGEYAELKESCDYLDEVIDKVY